MNKKIEKTHLEIIITLIGFGSLVFLIGKSRALNFEQYQQYRDTIDQLQKQESDLNQTILISRYELYVSYDPLVNNLKAQKELQQQLENIPDFLDTKSKQEIKNILKERETLLAQKESLSEWFKTQNALLKNSLRYLPLLASQLGEKVENNGGKISINKRNFLASLQIVFNDLLRNVLLYNITNDEKLVPIANQQIETLTQLKEQNKISEQEFPVQLAISHANIILTQKPQVEELTTQLLVSSPQKIEDFANLYSIYYQKARKTIRVYGFLRSCLFFMLIGWINYLFLKKIDRSRRKNSLSQQTDNIQQDTSISALLEIENENESVISMEKLEQIEDKEQNLVLEEDEKSDRIVESIIVVEERQNVETLVKNENVTSMEKLEQIEDKEQNFVLESAGEIEIIEQTDEDEKSDRIVESIIVVEERQNVEALVKNENVTSMEKLEQIEDKEQNFVLESAVEIDRIEQADEKEQSDRISISTLRVYPFNSKNLQIWIHQVDLCASSVLGRVQNYIQKKPCKIWLDRFAQFRHKREKIR